MIASTVVMVLGIVFIPDPSLVYSVHFVRDVPRFDKKVSARYDATGALLTEDGTRAA